MCKQKRLYILQTVLLICLVGTVFFSGFKFVKAEFTTASPFLFITANVEDVWKDLNNSYIGLADKHKSPVTIDGDTQYSNLGLDILVGTSRNLITYTGEIPYTSAQEEVLKNVPRLSYNVHGAYDVTSWDKYWGSNSNYDYWGFSDVSSTSVEKLYELAGEGATPVSLRLFALTKSDAGILSGIGKALTGLFYALVKGLTEFVNIIIGLLVSVKNINIQWVLNELGLEKLLEIFNNVFIGDLKNGKMSIFIILALISFLFALVGAVIAYIRGKNKKVKISDLLIFLLVGTVIAVSAFSGRIISIGESAANLVDNMVNILITDEMEDGIWKTATSDTSAVPTSDQLSLNQKSKINKVLIDIQLCTQFGVDNINELEVNTLFGSNVASSIGRLTYVSSDGSSLNTVSFTPGDTYYANTDNIGYYFWWANSLAPDSSLKPTNASSYKNGSFTDEQTIKNRMTGMMTYLQKGYNKADTTHKTKILKVVQSLAQPNNGRGIYMFFFTLIAFVLLGLCVWKIVLKILFAKILVAGSILGTPIAGPLIISGREKLVKYGKMIMFLLVSYSIQVLILSVLFDLIFTVVGVLLKNDLVSLILCIALLLMLVKFMPQLMAKLNELFNNIDRSISPEMAQNKRAIKAAAQRKVGAFNAWNNSREVTRKVVDSEGNVHKVKVKNEGSLSSRLGALLGNTFADARNRKSVRSIWQEGKKKSVRTSQEAAKQAMNEIKQETAVTKEAYDKQEENYKQSYYQTDDRGRVIENVDNINENAPLSPEQRELREQINSLQAEKSGMALSKRLSDKLDKIKAGENVQLTAKEAEEWNKYQEKEKKLTSDITRLKGDLKDSIDADISDKLKNSEIGLALKESLENERRSAQAMLDTIPTNKGEFKTISESKALADKKLRAFENGEDIDKVKLTQEEKDNALHLDKQLSSEENYQRIQRKITKQKVDSLVEQGKKEITEEKQAAAELNELENIIRKSNEEKQSKIRYEEVKNSEEAKAFSKEEMKEFEEDFIERLKQKEISDNLDTIPNWSPENVDKLERYAEEAVDKYKEKNLSGLTFNHTEDGNIESIQVKPDASEAQVKAHVETLAQQGKLLPKEFLRRLKFNEGTDLERSVYTDREIDKLHKKYKPKEEDLNTSKETTDRPKVEPVKEDRPTTKPKQEKITSKAATEESETPVKQVIRTKPANVFEPTENKVVEDTKPTRENVFEEPVKQKVTSARPRKIQEPVEVDEKMMQEIMDAPLSTSEELEEKLNPRFTATRQEPVEQEQVKKAPFEQEQIKKTVVVEETVKKTVTQEEPKTKTAERVEPVGQVEEPRPTTQIPTQEPLKTTERVVEQRVVEKYTERVVEKESTPKEQPTKETPIRETPTREIHTKEVHTKEVVKETQAPKQESSSKKAEPVDIEGTIKQVLNSQSKPTPTVINQTTVQQNQTTVQQNQTVVQQNITNQTVQQTTENHIHKTENHTHNNKTVNNVTENKVENNTKNPFEPTDTVREVVESKPQKETKEKKSGFRLNFRKKKE